MKTFDDLKESVQISSGNSMESRTSFASKNPRLIDARLSLNTDLEQAKENISNDENAGKITIPSYSRNKERLGLILPSPIALPSPTPVNESFWHGFLSTHPITPVNATFMDFQPSPQVPMEPKLKSRSIPSSPKRNSLTTLEKPSLPKLERPSLPQVETTDWKDFLSVPFSPENQSFLFPQQVDKIRMLTEKASSAERVCFNCKCTQTPMWRHAKNGDLLCNACGIYRASHEADRPLHLTKRKPVEGKKRVKKPKIENQISVPNSKYCPPLLMSKYQHAMFNAALYSYPVDALKRELSYAKPAEVKIPPTGANHNIKHTIEPQPTKPSLTILPTAKNFEAKRKSVEAPF